MFNYWCKEFHFIVLSPKRKYHLKFELLLYYGDVKMMCLFVCQSMNREGG